MKFAFVALLLPNLTSAFVLPPSPLPVLLKKPECHVGVLKASALDVVPFESTLAVSRFIYTFGKIRNFVKDHEETFNKDLSDKEKKKKKIVAFDTPALVDTRNSAAKPFPSTKMNNPVTASAMKEFLDRNIKYIKQENHEEDVEFVYDGSNKEMTWMAKELADLGSEFDADIIEFDDKFSRLKTIKTELVYSVVVNRTTKKIVIVFRGTTWNLKGGNIKDGVIDADFRQRVRPEVDEISTRGAKVHSGFSRYLLKESKNEEGSKLDQIMSVLKEVYAYKESGRDYSDYDLVITGHSLGGSLAQLLSFILAGSKEADFIPKPVTAITWASPVVGDKNFFLDYRDLEKSNKVRHIRVSNRNDVIACSPGLGITKPYWQTGVNIYLKSTNKKAEVKYENTRSIISQTSPISLKAHSPYKGSRSYYKRLFAKEEGTDSYINSDILEKSVEELYEEYAKLQD